MISETMKVLLDNAVGLAFGFGALVMFRQIIMNMLSSHAKDREYDREQTNRIVDTWNSGVDRICAQNRDEWGKMSSAIVTAIENSERNILTAVRDHDNRVEWRLSKPHDEKRHVVPEQK